MSENKHKIVFLGSDLSPKSLGCLKELASGNRYDFLVGIDQRNKSAWQIVKMTWRHHGFRGVVIRIMKLIVARSKLCLRPVGPNVQDWRSLREVAKLNGMETFKCSRVNGPDVRQIIRTFDPDLIVVAGFSQIIRSEVLEIPKFGVINFHSSLLPKYRGPWPYYWVIKNGEKKSGVSIHFIDEGIDTGDIIMQREFSVLPNDTENTLITRSIEIGAPLLARSVESVIAGTAHRRVQIESEATYFGLPIRQA
jgi:folate-dependent phosphoribosylglycinamide formyltransferase PurN